MANEKDIAEKALEENNDVFADIMNVALFGGQPVVKAHDLSDSGTRSRLKMDGKLHEQERDVAKFWKNGDIRIALCGLENQSKPDRDMVLRVIGYDGAAYKEQANQHISAYRAKEKPAPVYPTVTIVLYFGEERWTAPKTLRECFEVNIPAGLDRFIQDYQIHVFEVARLTPEQVQLFTSDFRIVADYLVQKRISKNYIASSREIRHIDSTMKLLSAITNDSRFVEETQLLISEGKGNVNMCEVLDKIEARGIAQGEARGRAAERAAIQTEMDEKDRRIAELERELAQVKAQALKK